MLRCRKVDLFCFLVRRAVPTTCRAVRVACPAGCGRHVYLRPSGEPDGFGDQVGHNAQAARGNRLTNTPLHDDDTVGEGPPLYPWVYFGARFAGAGHASVSPVRTRPAALRVCVPLPGRGPGRCGGELLEPAGLQTRAGGAVSRAPQAVRIRLVWCVARQGKNKIGGAVW